MHKQIIIILVFLLFLFFNLQAIMGSDIESPGICHAQATGTTAGAYDQKNNMEIAKKFRTEGEVLQKKGQLAAAIDKYELSQRYYPDTKLADHVKVLRNALAKQYMEVAKKLRAEGAVLQQQGKIEAAIVKYEQSLKYYPDPELDAHLAKLQDALYVSKKPKIELEGVPEGFRNELAVIENIKKDPSRANIEALAATRYQYALSLTKMATKKNDEDAQMLALVYAKSATELAPNNPDYWSLLGQTYDRIGADGEMAGIMAEDALQKAVELSPENNILRLLLGQSCYRHGNFSSALVQFEAALKRDSKKISPPTVATMCSAYILDSQYDRGVAFFRSILEKQPDADSARIALAILVHRQSNNVQAMEELDWIIKKKGASDENRAYALTLFEEWKSQGAKP
ncbi:MAG: tetratricopeptide repeat protein [Proteobacteria bacterium]|nr:tetratricopeptide repeat protein [Pseudomonadota bacterium]